MEYNEIHYPSRKYIAELNNTLILNLIQPVFRCIKCEIDDFKYGIITGISFFQAVMLMYLIELPNIEEILKDEDLKEALEMVYNL